MRVASDAWIAEVVAIDHAQGAEEAVVPVLWSLQASTEVKITCRFDLPEALVACEKVDMY